MKMTKYKPGTPCWVDLGSPNQVAAAQFYGGLFGWRVEDMGPDAGGYQMFYIGNKAIAGLGPQQRPGLPYWTSYVSVADAEATAASVVAAGGAVFMPPMDVMDAGRMAVFADSTGAPISIWQPGKHIGSGIVNEPGSLCWNELTTRLPDAAKAFYPAVFGWEPSVQQMGPFEYTEWKNDGQTIAGMMAMDESWPAGIPSHWMVYFAVEDTDAAAARVVELGGSVSVAPTDIPPGRFAVVNDPHGAVFSIIKPNPQPGTKKAAAKRAPAKRAAVKKAPAAEKAPAKRAPAKKAVPT